MRWDYITPISLFLSVIVGGIFGKAKIESILEINKSLPTEIFIFSTALLGIIITLYAILINVLPAFAKQIRKSTTLKESNTYFKFGLIITTIALVILLINLFFPNYYTFLIAISFMSGIIGMFIHIIFLIDALFTEISAN